MSRAINSRFGCVFFSTLCSTLIIASNNNYFRRRCTTQLIRICSAAGAIFLPTVSHMRVPMRRAMCDTIIIIVTRRRMVTITRRPQDVQLQTVTNHDNVQRAAVSRIT